MTKKLNKNIPQKSKPNNTGSQKNTVPSNKIFAPDIKLALFLGLISFVIYANTLKNGFALDDVSVITENTIVSKGVSAIPEIFSTPYRKGFNSTTNDFYRPLSLVMFAIEYQFFEKKPAPYHFFNILLFAGCVLLLFQFLQKLFGNKVLAFIAALLFALHPIHTEVVANIKSRDELLCFFFAFLSLNVFMKYINTGKVKQLVIGIFCFFLSLISKETVITFLAVIPFIFFFIRNENKKNSVKIIVGVTSATIIFLITRYAVLSFYPASGSTDIAIIDNALAKHDLAFESRMATAILILGNYIKLLFVPYPLICDYSFNTIPYVHFSNPLVLASLAIYIFLLGYGLKRILNNYKDQLGFGILFFLITLSLFSNIPFLLGATMGERFLFFPSVGFCLALSSIIEKIGGKEGAGDLAVLKQPKVLGVIIPLAIIFVIVIVNRNSEWYDNYTLYGSDVKKAPENSRLNYYQGSDLIKVVLNEPVPPAKEQEIYRTALGYLRKSLAIFPDYDNTEANLGLAFFGLSQYDSAEVHYKRAILLNPLSSFAIGNIAGNYFVLKNYPQAIYYYKKVIELQPDFVEPYANIGACYGSIGKFDSGIYYLYKAIAISPDYKKSYENLSLTYKIMGKLDSFKKYDAVARVK